MIVDQLRVLVWMNTEDATKGKRGKNRPEPLSPLARKSTGSGRHYGHTDRPAEEVAQLLLDVAAGKWSTAPNGNTTADT